MQFKEWSSDFDLGIGVIDKDHQNLFKTIHQLGDEITAANEASVISASIHSLLLYIDEHFDREERFMIQAGYPDFEAHKKEHDDFRDAIYSLNDFHKSNPDGIDAQKIVSFLVEWLLHHIAKVDKAYAPYLLGEKDGDPEIRKRFSNTKISTVQITCPADKAEHVNHFLTLINDASEEGELIEMAVEKIVKTQQIRRTNKAKKLFGL